MHTSAQISLPPHAKKALELLETAGFEAWCVGGCVRDSLLGLAPGDWDVTTSALPEEIKVCFGGCRVIETGVRHGTVTVLLEEKPVEITTYRSDGAYTDHRRPESVTFSRHLRDDLSRRDFTVNAMAYHPQRGLIDEFGGRKDLKNGALRCVGEPERRFTEDALRILRCLRFASVLGFSIEQETALALNRCCGLLKEISHERVQTELTRLLCGKDAASVLRTYSEVVFTVLPEMTSMKGCTQEHPFHSRDVWEHTLHALDHIPPEPVLRWAALLHDCGKPAVKTFDPDGIAQFYGHSKESEALADELLQCLRFSNREREEILMLIRLHCEVLPISEKRMKKLLGSVGEHTLSQLFQLIEADWAGMVPGKLEERLPLLAESRELCRRIVEENSCLTLRDLAVTGNDLAALGFARGPQLGAALDTLLEEVLDGRLKNEPEALLRRAGELLPR